MALLELNRDPTPRQVRQFGVYLLPGFCLLLAMWGAYRGFDRLLVGAELCIAVASLVVTLVRPRWTRALLLAWMWITFPIGWVISHTLLAAIYFLVITPIGLLMRAVGRDPLQRSLEPGQRTYWIERQPQREPSSYFRQF